MKHSIIDWESPAPRMPHAQVESIEHFSARGMHWVYGRGCTFGRMANFNLDAWQDRSGDIFVRFWSRNVDVDENINTLYPWIYHRKRFAAQLNRVRLLI